MNVHRILYPTDFSPCAAAALGTATSLARRFGAELHLFHSLTVQTPEVYDPMFYIAAPEEAYTEAARAAQRELETLAATAGAAGVGIVTAIGRDLAAGAAIVDYVSREQVDLVVMGTHGRRGPARLLLGSVAEEVIRQAPCPVLALRPAENGTAGDELAVRRILVPFDFSPPAREALRQAAELAQRLGATLTLLHVVEQPVYPEVYSLGAFAELAEEAELLRDKALLQLGDVATYLAPGVDCTVDVRRGRPATEIVAAAARPAVDLVVMATRGLTGIRRLVFGSTAEEVLRLAAVPVLVVKPPEERPRPLPGKAVEVDAEMARRL